MAHWLRNASSLVQLFEKTALDEINNRLTVPVTAFSHYSSCCCCLTLAKIQINSRGDFQAHCDSARPSRFFTFPKGASAVIVGKNCVTKICISSFLLLKLYFLSGSKTTLQAHPFHIMWLKFRSIRFLKNPLLYIVTLPEMLFIWLLSQCQVIRYGRLIPNSSTSKIMVASLKK